MAKCHMLTYEGRTSWLVGHGDEAAGSTHLWKMYSVERTIATVDEKEKYLRSQ